MTIEDYTGYFIYIQHFVFVFLGILPYLFTQFVLLKQFKKWWMRGITLFLIPILMGLGVMLGREFRFNSWDLFVDAGSVIVSLSKIAYDSDIRQGFMAFWILTQILSAISFLTLITKDRLGKWFSHNVTANLNA